MKKYLGIKIVEAVEMHSHTAHGKGYRVPIGSDVDGVDGYEVTYEDGYKSWSPKVAFEMANTELGKKEVTDGATTIMKERWEVLNVHGVTVSADAKLAPDALHKMAMFCIDQDNNECPEEFEGSPFVLDVVGKPEIERLAIAGALLAARIDVLRQG